jgi:hypothetical protein
MKNTIITQVMWSLDHCAPSICGHYLLKSSDFSAIVVPEVCDKTKN